MIQLEFSSLYLLNVVASFVILLFAVLNRKLNRIKLDLRLPGSAKIFGKSLKSGELFFFGIEISLGITAIGFFSPLLILAVLSFAGLTINYYLTQYTIMWDIKQTLKRKDDIN